MTRIPATIDEVDYTLTSGIVSSLTADGETSWASVDEVIEHDARIRGGGMNPVRSPAYQAR